MNSRAILSLLFALSLVSNQIAPVLSVECVREYNDATDTSSLSTHQYLNQYWKCNGADADRRVFADVPGLGTPWVAYDVTHGYYAEWPRNQIQDDAEEQCANFVDTPYAVTSSQGYGFIVHQIAGDITDFSTRLRELCVYHGFGGIFEDYCVPSDSACKIPDDQECVNAGEANVIDTGYGAHVCDGIFASVESRAAFLSYRKSTNAAQFALADLCAYDAFYVCHSTPFTEPNLALWDVLAYPALEGVLPPIYALKTRFTTPVVMPFLNFVISFVSGGLGGGGGRRRLTSHGPAHVCTFFLGRNIRSTFEYSNNNYANVSFTEAAVTFSFMDGVIYTLAASSTPIETVSIGADFTTKLMTVGIGSGSGGSTSTDTASFHFPSVFFNANVVYYSLDIGRQCSSATTTAETTTSLSSVNRVWSNTQMGAGYPGYNLRILSYVFSTGKAFKVSVTGISATAAASTGLDPSGTNASPYDTQRATCVLIFGEDLHHAFSTSPFAPFNLLEFVAAASPALTELRLATHAGGVYSPYGALGGAVPPITAGGALEFGAATDTSQLYVGVNGAYTQVVPTWSSFVTLLGAPSATSLEVGLLCAPGIDTQVETVAVQAALGP